MREHRMRPPLLKVRQPAQQGFLNDVIGIAEVFQVHLVLPLSFSNARRDESSRPAAMRFDCFIFLADDTHPCAPSRIS